MESRRHFIVSVDWMRVGLQKKSDEAIEAEAC